MELIPRLVPSNPSPFYIRSVVKAFRSGAYNGKMYFSSYNDLGATVARFFCTENVISLFPFLALGLQLLRSMSELFLQDMSKTEPKVDSVNDLRSKRGVF